MAPARRPRETIFQVRCETSFGAEVRLVGSPEALGRWNPARGLRLETSPKLYPNWRSRPTAILEEEEVEYKYIVTLAGRDAAWENCPNRRPPPAWREAGEDCRAVLIQHRFDDPEEERAVQLRPYPDRRAFSHLRKAALGRGTSFRGSGLGCGWHEEPAGGRSTAVAELLLDSCQLAAEGSSSGMTRASSSDSVGLLDEVATDDRKRSRRQLLVWPPGASAGVTGAAAVAGVEVLGSFTRPAWQSPLALHLCPETGVWWLAIEEALPGLQPGTYEFKFLLNGQDWATNPAMPVRQSAGGAQNNTLVIDRRLLARIERKAGQGSTAPSDANGGEAVTAGSEAKRHLRLSSDPGCSASASNEEGLDSCGKHMAGGSEDLSPDLRLAPRRAISTAERLCRASEARGTQDSQKRTNSLRYLFSSISEASLKFSAIESFVGDSEESDLYGADVALLLELPDVKRHSDLGLVAGAYYKPKDGTGDGEDAHFVKLPSLGVADGVGGLQHMLGHNSKAFAEDLMARCCASSASFAAQAAMGCLSPLGPGQIAQEILCEGYSGVEEHGAATAAIAWLDSKTNKLGVAVLGDSGVMVVRRPTCRKNESAEGRMPSTRSFVAFKSPPQQHDFNYPYQLCRLPAQLRKFLLCGPDKPTDCVTFEVDVEEGDLVLCYSDGVDDNLHDQEVLDICDRALSPYAAHVLGLADQDATPPELLSRAIGSTAYSRSRDEKARTPFGDEARKAGWPASWCRGGKEDDITCVAAWVQYLPSSHS